MVVLLAAILIFFGAFVTQIFSGNNESFFRNISQLSDADMEDLETMVKILHVSENLREDEIIEERGRRLSESSWDNEIEEVMNEKWMLQKKHHMRMKSFTGPGHYSCAQNQASSCQIYSLSSKDNCRIDILALHSSSSWKNIVPSGCVLECPTNCVFSPSKKDEENKLRTNDSLGRHLVRKKRARRKRPTKVVETEAVEPSSVSTTGVIENTNPLDVSNPQSGVFWIGPGNYFCQNIEDEDKCVSSSEQCKIDIMDWNMLQYFATKTLVGNEKKLSKRIPDGCILQCPDNCTFLQPQPHEETDIAKEPKNIDISPYSTAKCPDEDSTTLPCPNVDIWEKCDKYNGGDFLSCFYACKPSFCCIHDSKSINYSPSCSKSNANCPLYSPCYIVWWYLHDSIGPATFANFQWGRQKEAFYDNSFNVTEWRAMLNTSPTFFKQFYGHHFDKEVRPTDEEVQDPDNW